MSTTTIRPSSSGSQSFTCLPRLTVAGGVDAGDYAAPPGDCGDCSDSLGDWDSHKRQERREHQAAHAHRKARIGGKGNSKFTFPDQLDPGESWPGPARKAGASEEQLATALAMRARGLDAKARRRGYCGIIGARVDCVSFGPGHGHKFFRRYDCKNRYCPECGPKVYRELFAKYVGLRDVAKKLAPTCPHKAASGVVAKLDFTTKNLNRMPTRDEVRAFNQCVKRLCRRLERELGISRKGYGLIWCDEFGGKANTNLHAHALYAGPRLPRPKPRGAKSQLGKLAQWWRDACAGTVFAGSFIISVKPAQSFEAGLAHALKYAGKFLSRDPERLADLELSFHGVRRVHTLGAFYNAVPRSQASAKAEADSACPLCGALLVRVGGWCSVSILKAELRIDLAEARRQAARNTVFGERKAAPS
jgi:hypothetical protein